MAIVAASKKIVKKKSKIVKKKNVVKTVQPEPSTSDHKEEEEGVEMEEEPTEKEENEEVMENDEEEEKDVDETNEADDDDDDLEGFDEDAEEKEFVHPEKLQKKSGVLYFPSIPPKFTPIRLKEYFEKFAPGMIGRVYLERNKKTKSMENRYLEGWLEVKKKKLAKQLADMVDNKPVGGKKRDPTSSVLWNIKYLSGFKWVHLVEQLEYEKSVHNKRMSAEVSQARRVAAHFEEQIEKGEKLRKLEEKVLKQGGNWEKFQRQITQKKTVKTKKTSGKKDGGSKEDDLMKMIFAE